MPKLDKCKAYVSLIFKFNCCINLKCTVQDAQDTIRGTIRALEAPCK